MANYRNLFPNLTGADFQAPDFTRVNGNESYVVDWALWNSTTLIPYNRLPDLSSNALELFQFTEADPTNANNGLAAYVASFNANTDTGTGSSGFTAGTTLSSGDSLVLTIVDSDTGTGGDTGGTFSYIYVGDTKTADATETIVTGDFRAISNSFEGVSSITAGAGITLAGTEDDGSFYGNVTITSAPSIAPYTVQDVTAAHNAADGEVIALGTITTGTTATLPSNPTAGASIKFVNFNSGAGTWTIGRNGSSIQGVAEDLVLDDNTVSFELVFLNATRGWAIVGAN